MTDVTIDAGNGLTIGVDTTLDQDIPVAIVQGPAGKDGAPGTAAMEASKIYSQTTAARTWVIEHHLPQPISAVQLIIGGTQCIAPWREIVPGTVIIEFTIPTTGTAILG